MRLHVHRWGQGPRVVLVHGGVLGGRESWRAQRPLTERWTLLAPDRPGHGQSPPARQDFEPEAALVAEQLLDEPSHLVGLSYGGIVSMYAAASRPENVRSLTVIEPPCSGVARGVPAVDEYAAALRDLIGSQVDPATGLRRFFQVTGVPVEVPDEPHETLVKGMRQLLGARLPDEAEPPLKALRDAGFPILVVSGGHSEAYEAICDTIAQETGAERAVCEGRGHLVPEAPEFNGVLERFLNNTVE
ncbi:Pimeloyl-ACP methyl ester carboxylesterase [Lentzea waywayandensis]|uniref:Pimeloyl-ACP methyl ester carboxylesterase n=1 Tax=Lentzea waywayandensis TaxID=84724 RepID=A0A1I6F842_9PSEU|nr:alpha/beta hydrolase [Lentzea waywayandensis]SFR26060.1 Pimeloyl-ACP methyl ester carboxylesterase [Lentzea waywayandensis]